MKGFFCVLRREWSLAFSSPVAYLFIAAYALISTVATFEFGRFYARGQADLSAFFALQPWLLVWLAPSLSMRFWSEERRHGTLEALLTEPIDLSAAILAKWVAGLSLLTLALLSSIPLWVTVSYLGHPDHGAIFSGYLGSWALGAALLAVGSALSAVTRHQVSAFVTTTFGGCCLLLAGHPVVIDFWRNRVPTRWMEAVFDLSALPHHQALIRGVVGLDDLAYFAGLCAAGLLATWIALNSLRGLPIRVFRREISTALGLFALIIAVVALSATAPRLLGRCRFDLTEEHLYTLAPAMHRLIENLDNPVTLTLYASSQTLALSPPHAAQARRLRELLGDIAARARDRVHLTIVDPSPFSDDEDRAAESGLRSLPVGEAGDNLWLGLVAETQGARATIDLFEPDQSAFLEYRIARLIRQVSRLHKPVIGLLSTLPSGPENGTSFETMHPTWAIDDELREQYDVRDIRPDDRRLPDALDTLLILHPKGLTPTLLRSIDRYIVQGGHAMIAVDPDAQFDGQPEDSKLGSDHASTLEPLLRTWGLHFDPTFAVGDLDNALLVGAGRNNRAMRHLGFAGFGADSLSADDPLTAGLHRIDVATAGFFEIQVPAGVTARALIQTSASSAPFKVADLFFGATPETLRHGFHPTGRRYVVAAHLQGHLPSAFDENQPSSRSEANVIAIADTDWLADTLWIRDEEINGQRMREPWANNGDFLLNVVDALSGGDDLVGLRGREPIARPLKRLETIRNRADRRLAAQTEALERRLAAINRRIANLTGDVPGGASTNPQQRSDLADAELERRRLSRALRSVHHALDQEAARLGRWIYALNLLSIPLLIGVIATVLLRRRYRRAGL
jgi:hypothetical protein